MRIVVNAVKPCLGVLIGHEERPRLSRLSKTLLVDER
jgi:hypothetical protein